MYKKHLLHFVLVSLKFYFDLDQNVCYQIFYSGLLAISFFKLHISKIGAIFYDGLITVKEDMLTLRSQLSSLKERWAGSRIRDMVLNQIQAIKTSQNGHPRRLF